MGVSEKHVARLRHRGLKAIRLGSAVRYRPEDIQEFLEESRGPLSPLPESSAWDD